jgi:hypothetical protein
LALGAIGLPHSVHSAGLRHDLHDNAFATPTQTSTTIMAGDIFLSQLVGMAMLPSIAGV